MSNTQDKYLRLVRRLIALTESMAITWDRGVSENSYVASFPSYTVEIRRPVSLLVDTTLIVRDHSGRLVDTTGDVGQLLGRNELKQLFDLVETLAGGSDLDTLLSEIGG